MEFIKKKIVVAMSGGLDSSVAAALLKRAAKPKYFEKIFGRPTPKGFRGFDLIGVFMKFWSEPFRGSTLIDTDEKTDLHTTLIDTDEKTDLHTTLIDTDEKTDLHRYDEKADLHRYENRCCTLEAELRARKIAKILKIPFYVFNFEKEFKKRIVNYFLNGYKKGITPNPCVVCNKEIKFGLLLEKALALEADFVATGHYARINRDRRNLTKNPPGEKVKLRLLRGKDKNKDQSYFLWMLNQNQLRRILFPIGNYTRDEVEKLAKKFKLNFLLNIPKSMEICFIKKTINDFLKRYLKEKPGRIIDTEGKTAGKHQGLWFYTNGQRKGIGLVGGPAFAKASAGKPYYVLDKDLKKNLLIVTKNEKDLYKKELVAKNVNWISDSIPKFPLKVKIRIRYKHKPASAQLTQIPTDKKTDLDRLIKIEFDKPQRAITPGQSVVFYSGQEVLGGGIIY